MNDESDKVKIYTKLIGRYLNISKPNGVSEIEFELRPTGDDNEYYLSIVYVIPNDSIILKSRNLINQTRTNWNLEIVKTIKNYFGVDVIINSSGTQSESYYNRQKRYE